MEKKRVYSLDVIRVLLCIVIAFDHAEIFLEPGAGVAVLFFFVLSGFFLGKKFYEAPEEKPKKAAAKKTAAKKTTTKKTTTKKTTKKKEA